MKLSNSSVAASKRQNCAPSSLLPQPTPTHHLPPWEKARTGSRYPVLMRVGIGMVGPRWVQFVRLSSVALAEPIAPRPGPLMIGQKA